MEYYWFYVKSLLDKMYFFMMIHSCEYHNEYICGIKYLAFYVNVFDNSIIW